MLGWRVWEGREIAGGVKVRRKGESIRQCVFLLFLQGVRTVTHPSFQLRLLPSPASTDEMDDVGGSKCNGSCSDTSVGSSDRLGEGLGANTPAVKVSSSHATAGMFPATGAGGSSPVVVHGDETEERAGAGVRSCIPVTGNKSNSWGTTTLYRSPSSDIQERCVPDAVTACSDADIQEALQYSKMMHSLEVRIAFLV